MGEQKDSASLVITQGEPESAVSTTPAADVETNSLKRQLLKAITDKLKSDEAVHVKFIDAPGVPGEPETFLHLDSADGSTHLILVAEQYPGYPKSRKIALSWWEKATGASGYVRFYDQGYSYTGKTFEGGIYKQPLSSEEIKNQIKTGFTFISRLTSGDIEPTNDKDLADLESKVSGGRLNRTLMNTTINYYRERGWIDTISGGALELSPAA